ncbi:MAG: hypothetical protein ACPGUV_03525 [Polyangiales bacterium]
MFVRDTLLGAVWLGTVSVFACARHGEGAKVTPSKQEQSTYRAQKQPQACPHGMSAVLQCKLAVDSGSALSVCLAAKKTAKPLFVRASFGRETLQTHLKPSQTDFWLFTSAHRYGAALFFSTKGQRYAVFSEATSAELGDGRRQGLHVLHEEMEIAKTWPCRGRVQDTLDRIADLDVPLHRQEYPF